MGYLRNGWNWVHLFGSCTLAITLYNWIFTNGWAFVWSIVAGLMWELVDELNQSFMWNCWFLDSTGLDPRDILMDLAGIGLAVLILGVW